MEFKRGQVVFKEGDPSQYIYIVKSGEFEIAKSMTYVNQQKIDFTEFLAQFPHHLTKNKYEFYMLFIVFY